MFRIAAVRVTPILIADPPLLNVQGVHQPYTPRTIVEIETTSGVVGVGETYGDTDYLTVAQTFAPTLAGSELNADLLPSAVLDCAQRVELSRIDNTVQAEGLRGSRSLGKIASSVTSAFEVAMYDALGHETGLPVHALLGGKVRDSVEYSAYLFYRWAEHPSTSSGHRPSTSSGHRPSTSSGHRPSTGSGHRPSTSSGNAAGYAFDPPADEWGEALDPAGVVAQATRMAKDYGFTSFKLKGGVFEPSQEVATVKALAEAFPGQPLRLDPNGGWTVSTSLAVAAELEGIAEYLEDPTVGTPGMAEVAAQTSLPLATNMCVTSFDEIPEAFRTGAVQVVLSDHHYWGGLQATRELAAICRTWGVDLSMHSNTHLGISLAAMTQVAATIPTLRYACDTHRPWQTEDVITERHTFTDGRLPVTDTAGLGVELDRDSLAALHQRWTEYPEFRRRDDAAAMRKVHPDFAAPKLPIW